MSLKVWLGFRDVGTREPALRAAVRKSLTPLGWVETNIEDCDLAIWWGLPDGYQKTLDKLNGKPYIVIEFPFWGRGNKHNIKGSMFKVSLNGLHPLHGFWQGADESRALRTGAPKIQGWRNVGERILIAGMGEKGCGMHGYSYGQWDRNAVNIIKSVSDREIVFRPKPSCKYSPNIEGVTFEKRKCSLTALFTNIHSLVTHHGNSAVEALVHGIPVFCNDGVGSLMGHTDLTKIETPHKPENRVEFFNQLAWWQWSFEEIQTGEPFKWMLSKGLING